MTNTADDADIAGAAGAAAAPAIVVRDLYVRRARIPVLHGLSLTVPSGLVVGLLGPSGSGKTSLMRSIVGVQVVDSGSIEVLGRPAGSATLRKRVAYVTQDPSVYDDATVRQNLSYYRRVLGAPASDVDRAIERTDLGSVADRLAGSLSGGQRGRVSLAAALLGSPEVLVLDEPTVGLDPVLRVELWGLFHELAAEGATLLVSSHVMDEAKRCDRLLLMRNGELLADDTVTGVLASCDTDDMETAFLTLIRRGGHHPRHRAASTSAASDTADADAADADADGRGNPEATR
ncbi:ABC transporter ATP-binding protein [Agromyces bauzanensis]